MEPATVVIDNGTVQKTKDIMPFGSLKKVTFGKYLHKIFSNE